MADFLVKSVYYGTGATTGFAWAGVSWDHPKFAETLSTVILGYVLMEPLLNQAKYLLNDLRDRHRDMISRPNREAILETDVKPLIRNICFRLATSCAGAIIFLLFGQRSVAIAWVWIVGWQFVYEQWEKRPGRVFVLKHIAVAASYPMRSLVALALVLQSPTIQQVITGTIATLWVGVYALAWVLEYHRAQAIFVHSDSAEGRCTEACYARYGPYPIEVPADGLLELRLCAYLRGPVYGYARLLWSVLAWLPITAYVALVLQQGTTIEGALNQAIPALLVACFTVAVAFRARISAANRNNWLVLPVGIMMITLLGVADEVKWLTVYCAFGLMLTVFHKNWAWDEINFIRLRNALATVTRLVFGWMEGRR